MSGRGQRLQRVFPQLSALARARALLEAAKHNSTPDWRLRGTTPRAQEQALRGYESLIDAMFEVLFPHAIVVAQQVQELRHHEAMIDVAFLWGRDRHELISLVRQLLPPQDRGNRTIRYVRSYLERYADEGPNPAPQVLKGLMSGLGRLIPDEQLNQYDALTRLHAVKLSEGVDKAVCAYVAVSALLDEFADILEVNDVAHPELRTIMGELEGDLDSLKESSVRFSGPPMATPTAENPVLLMLRLELQRYSYYRFGEHAASVAAHAAAGRLAGR